MNRNILAIYYVLICSIILVAAEGDYRLFVVFKFVKIGLVCEMYLA